MSSEQLDWGADLVLLCSDPVHGRHLQEPPPPPPLRVQLPIKRESQRESGLIDHHHAPPGPSSFVV